MTEPNPLRPKPNRSSCLRHQDYFKRCLGAIFLVWLAGLAVRFKEGSQLCPIGEPVGSLKTACPPVPPRPLLKSPVTAEHPALSRAFRRLDKALHDRFRKGILDSLTIAVVTATGSVYERGFGPLRANETIPEKHRRVDRNSIYRVGSVSKLFTFIETLILQDRGVLGLDDPVTRFFPNFSYVSFGSDPSQDHKGHPEPITLRQLASHMSGIGRDLPAMEATEWPYRLTGPNGLPYPSVKAVFDAISSTPLVTPPYSYPIYSNTGWSLLAQCNVAANMESSEAGARATHEQLLTRDVLGPLGLNGTGFRATDSNRAHLAIPSTNSEIMDVDLGEWSNPAGGQMSSLADLITVMQIILDPTRAESVLSAYTVREWVRPIHSFEPGDAEVGVMWEIARLQDSYGHTQRVYQKYGNLGPYHSAFSVNPSSSFGVIVLSAGAQAQTMQITEQAFSSLQPAFDQIIAEATVAQFVGTWASIEGGGDSDAVVVFHQGSLWLDRLTLKGANALGTLSGSSGHDIQTRAGLWWTGAEDFRISLGAPGFEDSCIGHWATLDEYQYARGYPVNMIRFLGKEGDRVLNIPSLGISMQRMK